jgi:uncharacterized protein with HEPN domain
MNIPAPALEYVGHFVQAIERIADYAADLSEQAFQADRLRLDAVIRNLEVVGETSRNLDRYCPKFLAAYPALPIIQAYEMRDALSHGYFVWTDKSSGKPSRTICHRCTGGWWKS